MTEYYITHKKAAPAGSRNDLKSAKPARRGTNTLRHALARVNWGGLYGGILGALAAAAVWVPVAYQDRGYWAVGGEVFLIGLAAGLGGWIGGQCRWWK